MTHLDKMKDNKRAIVEPRKADSLSRQQRELVKRLQADPECGPSTELLYLFKLTGPVDFEALHSALKALVKLHPILSLRLQADGMRVNCFNELSAIPVSASDRYFDTREYVDYLLAGRLSASDILSKYPLCRAEVSTKGSTQSLALYINHLVHDGWSTVILWRDISNLYRFFSGYVVDCPTRSSPQYSDFVIEQSAISVGHIHRACEYWQAKTKTYDGRIQWPQSLAVVPGASSKSKRYTFTLSSSEIEALSMLRKRARVTTFYVLMCATAKAIHILTGQHHLLIGSNAANRERREWQFTVGYFANTRLLMLNNLSQSLVDVLHHHRDDWLTSADLYANVYIDLIYDSIGRPEPLKINMLNPSSMNCLGSEFIDKVKFPGVAVERINTSGAFQHWRDFEVTWNDSQGELFCEIWYRSPIDKGTVEYCESLIRKLLVPSLYD